MGGERKVVLYAKRCAVMCDEEFAVKMFDWNFGRILRLIALSKFVRIWS